MSNSNITSILDYSINSNSSSQNRPNYASTLHLSNLSYQEELLLPENSEKIKEELQKKGKLIRQGRSQISQQNKIIHHLQEINEEDQKQISDLNKQLKELKLSIKQREAEHQKKEILWETGIKRKINPFSSNKNVFTLNKKLNIKHAPAQSEKLKELIALTQNNLKQEQELSIKQKLLTIIQENPEDFKNLNKLPNLQTLSLQQIIEILKENLETNKKLKKKQEKIKIKEKQFLNNLNLQTTDFIEKIQNQRKQQQNLLNIQNQQQNTLYQDFQGILKELNINNNNNNSQIPYNPQNLKINQETQENQEKQQENQEQQQQETLLFTEIKNQENTANTIKGRESLMKSNDFLLYFNNTNNNHNNIQNNQNIPFQFQQTTTPKILKSNQKITFSSLFQNKIQTDSGAKEKYNKIL